MDRNGITEPDPDRRDVGWLDNPWLIVGLLFCVTGALGIPVIWISRAFSFPAKVILTITVSIYTVALLWGFWVIMTWSYHRILESL